MKSIEALLRKLTTDDLCDWAGETIVNRGRGYLKRVDQLARTEQNTLAAWVTGTERYATSVDVDETDIESYCSCPYDWGPCKHAVAVILAAVEYVKSKQTIPPLDEDSNLWDALFANSEEDSAWLDDECEDDESPHPFARRQTKAQVRVAKIIGDKSRDELLELVIDLAGRLPDVHKHLVEVEQLASGQVDKIIRGLKSEIQELSAQPSWHNHWRDEGNSPDYSHVKAQLQALHKQGHADAVLTVGEELWARANAQIEQSDDDGQIAMTIASCLLIVLAAVPRSSHAPSGQLLWVIERVLEDEYGLLDAAEKLLKRPTYTRLDWQEVANTLESRLQGTAKPRSANFIDGYQRSRLLHELLTAYERAGWNEKIIPRLEDEADACQCYSQLVDALLKAGEMERARQWCIQGYIRTVESAPGIASKLQERLRAMAQKERRYDLVAAYRAQDFFGRHSASNYTDLRKAAEKAKGWASVRDAVLRYLESGQHPLSSAQNKKKKNDWPLPAPEVEPRRTTKRNARHQFPDRETLIDIAIMEKRFDDVVDLYQDLRNTKRWGWEADKRVAQAVAESHADVALTIWKDIVCSLIDQVKPRAYEQAAVYLRLMQKVYTRDDRQDDWRALLLELRSKHKAKRRLIEVLDLLTKKKLVRSTRRH
ncbi:MAG: putative Zn finger protein [Gammaproteobacteria bacterium]